MSAYPANNYSIKHRARGILIYLIILIGHNISKQLFEENLI